MTRALIPLLVAFVALAASLTAYVFWYRFVAEESAAANALLVQITQQSQEASRVAAAKETLTSLESDEASVAQYFVKETDIVSFLAILQKTGKDVGATIEVASVSADEGIDPRITLSLKISGSFDSVLRTLGSIEYGPYDSSVRSISLSAVPDAGGKSLWEATGVFVFGAQKTSLSQS